VTTDEDVINMLTNLPKDLPEAFENALSRIIDKRYGGTVMKFVAAATHPLKIDELRVALTVEPGEPIWHPTKLPNDGEELVSLSGGNLIEFDEEDNRVRFIHHSVLLHLFSPSSSAATLPYHFTPEESDHCMGITCVTYIQFPVFDTRMNVQRKIKVDDIANKVSEATTSQNTLIARASRYFLNMKKTKIDKVFDIGRLASEIQSHRIQSQALEKSLFAYANQNWLVHTQTLFKERDVNSWRLWTQLINDDACGAELPFPPPRDDPMPAMTWAARHSHGALFLYLLHRFNLNEHQLHNLTYHNGGPLCFSLLRGQWLGDIIAQYVGAGGRDVTTVRFLMRLGADPAKVHHITTKAPLQIVLEGSPHDGIPDILETLLTNSAVVEILAEDWVGASLANFVSCDDHEALSRILPHRPNLYIPPPKNSLLGLAVAGGHLALARELLEAGASANCLVFGKPAFQIALEYRRKDMVELLAPAVNVRMPDENPVLYMALCNMSDEWAELLLELGASPDSCIVISEDSNADNEGFDEFIYRYPLEVAIENDKTAASLALINRVANVNLGEPLDIALRIGNDIIISRLLEVGAESRVLPEIVGENLSSYCFSSVGIAWKLFPDFRANVGGQTPIDSNVCAVDMVQWRDDIDTRIHIVDLLLQGHPSPWINAQDDQGQTALHYAVRFGVQAIRQLLNAGADPNILNNKGESPLLLATSVLESSSTLSLVVAELLKAGADPNVTTPAGVNPLDIIILSHRHRDSVLPLLRKYGARFKRSFPR
jgi:ankyrin repeat protein